jgi:hypothetical protein
VEGTDERREWRAHRGGGSTCGVGAEAARWCSETVGGGGFSVAAATVTTTLHLREREGKVRGARIDARRRRLAAHREGERWQRLGGNRRGAMGFVVQGG